MSRLVIVAVIITLILALSLSGVYYAKDTKVQLFELADVAIEQCKEEDAAELISSAKKMSAFFESRHGFLSFFVRHDEIEKMEADLVSLVSYSQLKSFDNAYFCLNHIRYTINHIYNRELPNWDNLF